MTKCWHKSLTPKRSKNADTEHCLTWAWCAGPSHAANRRVYGSDSPPLAAAPCPPGHIRALVHPPAPTWHDTQSFHTPDACVAPAYYTSGACATTKHVLCGQGSIVQHHNNPLPGVDEGTHTCVCVCLCMWCTLLAFNGGSLSRSWTMPSNLSCCWLDCRMTQVYCRFACHMTRYTKTWTQTLNNSFSTSGVSLYLVASFSFLFLFCMNISITGLEIIHRDIPPECWALSRPLWCYLRQQQYPTLHHLLDRPRQWQSCGQVTHIKHSLSAPNSRPHPSFWPQYPSKDYLPRSKRLKSTSGMWMRVELCALRMYQQRTL